MAAFVTLLVGVIVGVGLRGRWWWQRVDRRLGLLPSEDRTIRREGNHSRWYP